jgi:hypothetical protein
MVQRVMSVDNPLERELTIDQFRWQILDDLILSDRFGAFALHAFMIKLIMAHRWQGFNDAEGKERVENIVQSNIQQGMAEK